MDKLVKIKNLSKAALHLGKDVARQRKIPLAQFKYYITPKEVRSIIKQYAYRDDDGCYLLNYELLHTIVRAIDNWVLGIELSKLAALDSVDTYWDDKLNCMIFAYNPKTLNNEG